MIVKRLTGLRKLALTMFLFACLYQVKGAVQDGESGEYLHRIRQIDLPLIEISTVDGVEPTCVFVQPPPGCMGNGITGNNYVPGRITITIKGQKVYDSGDYIKGERGMRIKIRGNSSAYPLKKPYKVKLSKKADLLLRGDDDFKDKEWLLLGNYQDTHTLQTVVGMKIGLMVGMEWQPAYCFAHVLLNGSYKGCYLLCEAVEKGRKRCDISDTGYLIENDAYWWNTEDVYFHSDYLTPAMGYTFKYPDPDDLDETLVSNIKGYIEEFGQMLHEGGDISEYIDISSFAGWTLGHDILGTLDGCGSNMFLYKEDYNVDDHTSSKLKMGPMWDFDSTYKMYGKWSSQHGLDHFYVKRLFQREDFLKSYINIWKRIRNNVYSEVMDEVLSLQEKQGKAIMDCRRLEEELTKYYLSVDLEENIDSVSRWFESRIAWLDEQIEQMDLSGCDNCVGNEEAVSMSVYDVWGKLCCRTSDMEHIKMMEKGKTPDFLLLPRGVYAVHFMLKNGSSSCRKVIIH